MVVERNYVEPTRWARAIRYPLAREAYLHVAPIRWILDPVHDAYKRLTGKPAGWYGWWEAIGEFTLEAVGYRVLATPPAAWLLSCAGLSHSPIDLSMEFDYRCAYCGSGINDFDCCVNRWLYVSDAHYHINGAEVPPSVFQRAYDEFLIEESLGLFHLKRIAA